jgi:hypothetical protein
MNTKIAYISAWKPVAYFPSDAGPSSQRSIDSSPGSSRHPGPIHISDEPFTTEGVPGPLVQSSLVNLVGESGASWHTFYFLVFPTFSVLTNLNIRAQLGSDTLGLYNLVISYIIFTLSISK